MDVVVRTHTIPSIGTLSQENKNAWVRLELDWYFDDLMRIATNLDLVISVDTMHQYVVGPEALKTMMCMLSDELDRGAQVVYPNAMEARVRFQKDVTLEYTDTIADYRAWHQFTIIGDHEDVEELVFPLLCES